MLAFLRHPGPAWCPGSRSIPAWCIGEAEDVRPGPEGGFDPTSLDSEPWLPWKDTRTSEFSIKEVVSRSTLTTYTRVVNLQLCQRWYCFSPKMALCLGKNRCFPLWFHASHLRIDDFLRSMIEWVGDCWRRGMRRPHFSQRQFGLFCDLWSRVMWTATTLQPQRMQWC